MAFWTINTQNNTITELMEDVVEKNRSITIMETKVQENEYALSRLYQLSQ